MSAVNRQIIINPIVYHTHPQQVSTHRSHRGKEKPFSMPKTPTQKKKAVSKVLEILDIQKNRAHRILLKD